MTIEPLSLVLFSVQMALAGVLLILPLGVGLGFWLARTDRRFKSIVETFATLPLVLPPTVVGLLLLETLGRNGPLGRFVYDVFELDVAFTYRAVILASAVVAFPLLVRTVRASFEEIDPRLEAIARTLGRRPLEVFFTVSLPLAFRGVLAGLILAFTRALGEFGATIMVAGNIPGETQTLSLAIFQLVQLGRDPEAYGLAALSVIVALLAIGLAEHLSRKGRRASRART